MSIVGRTRELAVLARAAEEGTRLVTIVGPGGIGKTTLAAAHAAGGRSLFVDLSDASTEPELVDRIATACGAPSPGDGAAGIGAVLDARGALVLVLDDFDRLVPLAAATVGRWLDRCPELAIVVTARQRLGVAGESVLEVGALDPVADGVGMLVAAARRRQLDYAPRADEAGLLTAIATELEGVPLALELASARLPVLGAAGLLDELRRDGATGLRDPAASPRHRSLEAALRGSFDALTPREQDVLAELTVFRGGFTLEAVGGISGADGPPIVEALRARSLVRSRGSGRFDLYAPVREIVAGACPRPIRRALPRHAEWFAAEAERVAARAHAEPAARTWLHAERENLLAIAARVLDGGPPGAADAEPALRAVVAAKDALFASGATAELAELVSPIVERTRDSGADPRLSARAMALRGVLRRTRGDLRGALKDLLAAESVARALPDVLLDGEVSVELGRTVRVAGELEAARRSFDRAARAFAEVGARAGEAEATALLAATHAELGDALTATMLCQRAVALAGGDCLIGPHLHVLVARAHAETRDPVARRSAEEAVRRAESDGSPAIVGAALALLGLIHHDGGRHGDARAALARARETFGGSGLEVEARIAGGHLGALAAEEGRVAEAYAALADASDAATRARVPRPAHTTYFGAHLAAIEARAGRKEAAAHLLVRCEAGASARDPDPWWPLHARDVLVALRASLAGEVAAASTLHGRLLVRALAAGATLASLPPDDALVVGEAGAWFRPPVGSRVGLERRRSLALLLDYLAARPGTSASPAALFAVAWPGERAIATAAAHRVRVAVATLRKLGLRDDLVTMPDGYGLRPGVPVVRA